jgi:TonB family protein
MIQIGPYRIEGELGRGAMGVVFRGVDPVIGRTVAVKTIHLSEFQDPTDRNSLEERLLREARSAGILSHPNIVTVYHVGKEGDLAYIVMEFVSGPTLARVMSATRRIAREKLVEILRQTASALDYAHQNGVVHRDVKPANIMLQESGAVKITDFGVAKLSSQSLTKTGMSVGTPAYMPAEQIQGKAVDGRADQYAMAVLAYELITGTRPFEADTLTTLLFKIVYEQPVPPHSVNPEISPSLEPVFRKALSKNPAERYETCADFVRHFERAMVELPRAAKRGNSAASRRKTKILTACFTGLVLIGAGGVYLYDTNESEGASVAGPVESANRSSLLETATQSPPTPKPPGGANTAARAKPQTFESAKPIVLPGSEQAKKLIRRVPPEYPSLAQTARIEGEVFLSLLIARDGTVKRASALHGHPYLIPAALKAASQWLYQPTLVNGTPVEVETDVAVVFKLKRQ